MKIEYDFREQNKCESADTIQMTHISIVPIFDSLRPASAWISSLYKHEKSERLDPRFHTALFFPLNWNLRHSPRARWVHFHRTELFFFRAFSRSIWIKIFGMRSLAHHHNHLQLQHFDSLCASIKAEFWQYFEVWCDECDGWYDGMKNADWLHWSKCRRRCWWCDD